MFGHWTWSYWHDEENKPKATKPQEVTNGVYCDHYWVDKPLFSHVHRMCDKCGVYYSEWLDAKSKKDNL